MSSQHETKTGIAPARHSWKFLCQTVNGCWIHVMSRSTVPCNVLGTDPNSSSVRFRSMLAFRFGQLWPERYRNSTIYLKIFVATLFPLSPWNMPSVAQALLTKEPRPLACEARQGSRFLSQALPSPLVTLQVISRVWHYPCSDVNPITWSVPRLWMLKTRDKRRPEDSPWNYYILDGWYPPRALRAPGAPGAPRHRQSTTFWFVITADQDAGEETWQASSWKKILFQ